MAELMILQMIDDGIVKLPIVVPLTTADDEELLRKADLSTAVEPLPKPEDSHPNLRQELRMSHSSSMQVEAEILYEHHLHQKSPEV